MISMKTAMMKIGTLLALSLSSTTAFTIVPPSTILTRNMKSKWVTNTNVNTVKTTKSGPNKNHAPYWMTNNSSGDNDTNEKDDLQVLRLKDPQSGRPIILVGCMHYNPVSIQKSQRIVQELANQNKLYAVLVESCPSRWSKATEFLQQLEQTKVLKQVFDVVLPNEMRAAATIAQTYDRPVILGDQNIELTGSRVKECFQRTIKDITHIQHYPQGLLSIGSDVRYSFSILMRSFGLTGTTKQDKDIEYHDNKSQLSLYPDYFDLALLASMPFSFVRYPLGIALRNPLFFGGIVLLLTFLDQTPSALWTMIMASTAGDVVLDATTSTYMTTTSTAATMTDDVSLSILSVLLDDSNPLSWIATLMVAALEVLIFGRVLAMPILAERDVILAQSIVSVATNTNSYPLQEEKEGQSDDDKENEVQQQLMMATGKDIVPYFTSERLMDNKNDEDDTKDQALVAILGMAHCNGVKKIILEQSQ
mmetsp:Transcript_21268/g.30098  ORF Transcript_21268/g.30098 Transcript_21268/m.30098 type:complete len:477 (-) Transcript_21268:65-1495(-)